jgi:hypothetical protein
VRATYPCGPEAAAIAGPLRYRSAKSRNVGQFGSVVAAAVLSERDVSVDERRLHRRKLGRAETLLAQELVDRTGTDRSQEHSLRIDPAAFDLWRSHADEHGPRCAQCDQLVRVHGQIAGVQWPRILDEISGDPVVFAGAGDVLDLLAEVAPVELGAAFS